MHDITVDEAANAVHKKMWHLKFAFRRDPALPTFDRGQ